MSIPLKHLNPISKRWQNVGKSIFSEMTALAQQHSAINLGQGFPDFYGPQKVLDCISHQLFSCHNQYAPSPGELPLRMQIAKYTLDSLGVSYDPQQEITITNGATEALYSAIQAFVNPGDRVVVFEPAFDTYTQAIAGAGGVVVPVRLLTAGLKLGIGCSLKLIFTRLGLIV